MTKYFPGITHVIISTVPSPKEMESMKGTIALAQICFGPGDDDTINMIAIKKMEGPTTGVQAYIPKAPVMKDGQVKYLPVFTGKAAEELRMSTLIAFDRMRQVVGLKFNKCYRIIGKNVEEIVYAQCSTGLAQQPTV